MSAKRWLTDNLPLPLRSAGRYWYRRASGKLDPAMAVLRPVLRPGTTAIDVGAHNGVYTYFFARSGLNVKAFEPLPDCQAVLAAMPVANVQLHRTALSDTTGVEEIVVPVQNGAPETQLAHLGQRQAETVGRRCSVNVATLDSFAFTGVSIVKIDVEGHELAVLRGASETLQREHPILYIEIEARHAGASRVLETFRWLSQAQYLAFFVGADGALAPGEEFVIEMHQERFLRGDTTAAYINNFLFAHASDATALQHFHTLARNRRPNHLASSD